MKDHNKKFHHYLSKSQFKLVCQKNEDITTNTSWSNYLRETIDSLK